MIKNLVHRAGRWYVREVCKREYDDQGFRWINERPVEYRFLLEQLSRTCPTTVLDVGTGTTALPHLLRTCGFVVTAIDNVTDYWKPGEFANRHYHVVDDDILKPKIGRTFDFVACISVLEHIPAHDTAVASMFQLLNPGGHLALTFPYNEATYIDNVYNRPGAGYGQDLTFPAQVYSRAQVDGWLARSGGELVEQEYWRMFTGEFWTFGERLRPPVRVGRDELHQLTCLLFRKPAR